MSNKLFDRNLLSYDSIDGRKDEILFRDAYDKDSFEEAPLTEEAAGLVRETAEFFRTAKKTGASRMLTFGTDLIENGLGPVIGCLVREGWITHLATTGTAVTDDFEFAYHGAACEDSSQNLRSGAFGMWEETARPLCLSVLVGNYKGLGLGESVSEAIAKGFIEVPDESAVEAALADLDNPDHVAAAAELLSAIRTFHITPGKVPFSFPYKENSLLYMAAKKGVQFTVHPQFGLDTVYMHPMCSFAAVGASAERDFLRFVSGVDNLENGVYLSVGSSVASPMIFEKALSMSQNVRYQHGDPISHHKIVVVDLAPSRWDWTHDGEPPENRPEYYLRYCKSFSRAKAEKMLYVSADNRVFFKALADELERQD